MQILGLFFTNSKDRKQKSYALHEQKSLLRRPPYRYGGPRSKRKVDFYAISPQLPHQSLNHAHAAIRKSVAYDIDTLEWRGGHNTSEIIINSANHLGRLIDSH